MKKLVILLIILLVPSVFALNTQQWLAKHSSSFQMTYQGQIINLPVKSATNTALEVYDSQGVLKGKNIDPVVGDDLLIGVSNDFVWGGWFYILDDNFNVIYTNVLNGNIISGGWLDGLGESNKFSTNGWNEQDYHVITYSCELNWQNSNSLFYPFDCAYEVYTFTLQSLTTTVSCSTGQNIGDVNNDGTLDNADLGLLQDLALQKLKTPQNSCCVDIDNNGQVNIADIQKLSNAISNKINLGTCSSSQSTTQTIGPLPSKNIPNCITPTDGMKIDKDTTLCFRTYNFDKGIEIIKDRTKLDCNGATLFTDKDISLISFKKGGVTITNCILRNKNLYEELGIFGEGEEVTVQNNFFDSNVVISNTGNSYVQYNDFNEGELTIQEADKVVIEKNKFVNECSSLGSLHEYGSVNLRKDVQNSQVKNNDIEDKNGCSNDDKGIVIHYKNHNNIISENKIIGMSEGIFFRFEDNFNNQFIKNTVETSQVGILIRNPKSLDSNKDNKFIKNNLINNDIQIEDYNNQPNTYENNYITGFSDDVQQCNDTDNDNICNTPFLIYSIPPQYGGTQQTQKDLRPSRIKN